MARTMALISGSCTPPLYLSTTPRPTTAFKRDHQANTAKPFWVCHKWKKIYSEITLNVFFISMKSFSFLSPRHATLWISWQWRASPGNGSMSPVSGCWWLARLYACGRCSRKWRAWRSWTQVLSTRVGRQKLNCCGRQKSCLECLCAHLFMYERMHCCSCVQCRDNLPCVPQNHAAHSCDVNGDPHQIKRRRVDFWIARFGAEDIPTIMDGTITVLTTIQHLQAKILERLM